MKDWSSLPRNRLSSHKAIGKFDQHGTASRIVRLASRGVRTLLNYKGIALQKVEVSDADGEMPFMVFLCIFFIQLAGFLDVPIDGTLRLDCRQDDDFLQLHVKPYFVCLNFIPKPFINQ